MKFKWIQNNRNIIRFIVGLAVLGFITGIILYYNSSNEIKASVLNEVSIIINAVSDTKQNNILFHLALLSILLVLSIIVIGLPIIIFYYFYEFVSIGYLLTSLFFYKKISGLLFGSIFILINKILFLLFLSYFIINSIKYSKRVLKGLKMRKSEIIVHHLYKGLFIIILSFINDIILYFIGNKLLSVFLFLI